LPALRKAIAYGVTPTPYPSPQGGKGSGMWTPGASIPGDSGASKSPSPMWGGVRGGGMRPQRGPLTSATALRPFAGSLAVLAALAVASLFVGVGTLSPGALVSDPDAVALMFASRLPRTLAAILAGSGLAIGGLVMQTLARNRFVEPTTAGTAQGAALGILIVTILAPGASILVKTVVASIAALGATSVFLSLAHRLPPTQPILVPLFGLIYGGVVGAAVTYIAWQADLLQLVEVWIHNGEFSGILRG